MASGAVGLVTHCVILVYRVLETLEIRGAYPFRLVDAQAVVEIYAHWGMIFLKLHHPLSYRKAAKKDSVGRVWADSGWAGSFINHPDLESKS